MRILLFGSDGQVGWELQRSLAPLGELIALSRNSLGYCGDFTNLDGIVETIRLIAPDIIVNAAAYTAVDSAESEVSVAEAVNVSAPAVLASEAKRIGAWLIHFSSDYVFDGGGQEYWQETDKENPLNIYGKTKLGGELVIRNSGCKYLIFRTSWVYSARGQNFAKTMLRLAKSRDYIDVINDQFGAPTGADLLADVTAHCIRHARHAFGVEGVYHVAAAGITTWYDYAKFVIDSAVSQGWITNSIEIKPILSDGYPVAAKRPANSRLNTRKLQSTFNLVLPRWETGVVRMLAEMNENKI